MQYDGHVEAMGAYTPLPHVLMTVAAAMAIKLGEQNYLVNRQAEIGLGTYWKLGNKWLLNGIGGAGTAYGERKESGFFSSGYNRGNYQKLFGQAGLAYQKHKGAVGITYRLGRIYYRNIQHNDSRPIPLFRDTRHEYSLFYRHALGNQQKWYVQSILGLSLSSLRPSDDNYRPFASDKWFAAGGGEYLFSIGAVWRPSISARKSQ
ncbi:hypothetical protein [Hymenobacter sp. NBH84]|uniref:hypothetical protein n=1 Tax=Hymenobacter sp. NBH84 TaxID=2596915 RepID=UPI00162654B3|nr:hypothetical protein [Hymenobacter sp. NBH84]